MRLSGYAIKWGSPSLDLGGFTEVFRRGAFARTLREDGDIFFLHSHKPDALVGSRNAGTLRLEEDATGLRFELDTPDTSLGNDIAELVKSKILRGTSIGFVIRHSSGERWSESNGQILREVLEADLLEISSTQWPAYPAATITAKRSSPSSAVRRADMLKRLLDRTTGGQLAAA